MIFLTDSQLANVQDATPNNVTFFNKQLTRIVSKLFEVKHRAIKFREYFEIDNEGGPGITSIEMYVWDMVGQAKLIGHYADDLPSAGAGAASVTVPVRWVGASFHVSWMEIQQGIKGGVNLSDRRAKGANLAIDTKLNKIMFGTDDEATAAGLFGLLNHPNVPLATIAAGASSATEWSTKTPDEIYNDFVNLISSVDVSTDGIHSVDTVALPIEQLNILRNTRLNEVSSDTILDAVLKNSKYIQGVESIISMPELRGAGPNGEDVIMAYDSDAENAVGYIPYEKNTPVGTLTDGIAYKTPIITSTGGLDIRYPLAFAKAYGI